LITGFALATRGWTLGPAFSFFQPGRELILVVAPIAAMDRDLSADFRRRETSWYACCNSRRRSAWHAGMSRSHCVRPWSVVPEFSATMSAAVVEPVIEPDVVGGQSGFCG